jgi:hypothetical protein
MVALAIYAFAILMVILGIVEGNIVLIALGLIPTIGITMSIMNHKKDVDEGITRVNGTKGYKDLAEKRMALRAKYGNPMPGDANYEAYNKEWMDLQKTVRYGPRDD